MLCRSGGGDDAGRPADSALLLSCQDIIVCPFILIFFCLQTSCVLIPSGLAVTHSSSDGVTILPQPSGRVGTNRYMAPEVSER